MLMTGPGGTGKTYVVQAVKMVMAKYGCAHKIRFLAPTGSAASNIDGMTIHKGLGIKLTKKDGRGKGNRAVGDSSEDMTVLVSIQNKVLLREEWKNVDIVLIDEISLTSAQLLCEIDYALRFAKEKPDDWFGGITVIFAGDFYQYPPVAGTPLYAPISSSTKQDNNELHKRLGRLAWKSIDTVVEFTEQQRMKLDSEYSEAVQRLRIRKCNEDDVNLFNSCVISSPEYPKGIDMGSPENLAASAIVGTNHLREVLNIKKAHTMGGSNLVMCASRDIPALQTKLTKFEYESLLKQNFTSAKNQGALPGFLPLYVSMPVILRLRNISTELKIANGSQGIVHRIFTEIDDYGLTYCPCAVVEFKDSPVHLENLPRGYFPIFPTTFHYSKKIALSSVGHEEVVRFTRHQLPIQPAFAVTGHSAQGKTLPKVIAFLNEGGFAAYVAASRARSRDGICTVHPVTLNDLNKPLPHDLYMEVQRLKALEINTSIKHGFGSGSTIQIPDPESEITGHKSASSPKVLAEFITPSKDLEKSLKRKHSALNERGLSVSNATKKKKDLNSNTEATQDILSRSPYKITHAGCRWNPNDWSCAYDTVFMSLYACYLLLTPETNMPFIHSSTLSRLLWKSFGDLESLLSTTTASFDYQRDQFRKALFEVNGRAFPISGREEACLADIIDCIFGNTVIYHIEVKSCSAECIHCSGSMQVILPSFIVIEKSHCVSLRQYLYSWLTEQFPTIRYNYPLFHHRNCGAIETACERDDTVIEAAGINGQTHSGCQPVLAFELHPIECWALPDVLLQTPSVSKTCQYRLAAIIYHGNNHFAARLLLPDLTLWKYDGQLNGGTPVYDGAWSSADPASLMHWNSMVAHMYLYVHNNPSIPR